MMEKDREVRLAKVIGQSIAFRRKQVGITQ